jgi:tetratricopeptide (TPR) repeat protein
MSREGQGLAFPLRASDVTWPVRSGAIPPLADNHSPRPETGAGLVSDLAPAETVVLTPPDDPGEQSSPERDSYEHDSRDRGPRKDEPGGTGKTQLATALAHVLWESRAVELLIWVTASSREAVVMAYTEALADIGIVNGDEDPEASATRLLAWLAETGRPWLMVFDDLADPADLAGLWPQGAAGRILVTTQHNGDELRGPRRRIVPVGPFTLREALTYLIARLHDDPGQRTEALDLAQDLGCHPLALAQATALLIDTGASCRDFRFWSADRARHLASIAPGEPPSAMEVTWSLTVERANQLPPAGLAEPALVLAAMMDTGGIPGSVLVSHAACSYITGHHATGADQAQVAEAVNNLYRLSLLSVNPESTARTVAVPAIVQALVLKNLAPGELDRAARAAADALLEAWPEHDAGQPLLSQALRDSTAVLNMTAAELLWTPQGHGVLIRAGQSRDAARLRGAAIAYWRDMAAASTRLLGPGHAQTLLVSDHLAAAEGTVGRLGAAVEVHERTLADREWALGAGHPDTLAARGNLAHAYQQAGRLRDALPLYERTLADRERAQGPSHPDTLTARGNLAQAYQEAGLLKEAITLYERTLAGRERTQGRDHPDTLTTRGNLAYAYRSAGRLKNAIPQYERTLADRERVLGPDHPDTLTARGNLANAYHSARRVKDALSLYEQTLADCERVLGPDHLSTLTSRGNLAHAYLAAQRLTDATATFERALADCERTLGPSHPLTEAMRDNLAAISGG